MDVTPTGGADDATGLIAQALRRLESAADLPLEERPDAVQAMHEDLRSALAEIDDA